MRVLHGFGEYLHPTENWAYRLITNLEDVDIAIAAVSFLKNNYYDSRFDCIEFPLRRYDRPRRGILERVANTLLRHSMRLYPGYLKRHAGPLDLVHSHFLGWGCVYDTVARSLKVPHVVSCYGADYCREDVIARRGDQYERLFKSVALVICEGKSAMAKVEALGCPPDKLRVVRLGVDPDTVPVFRRTKESQSLDLLLVASWRQKKGHTWALQAFKHALGDCSGMTLTLAGPDPDGIRASVLAPYADLQESGIIRVQDSIDPQRLHAYMKDFHVFLHPSCHADNGDAEGGSPVVLLDAQATGMPVISTRHCDIPENMKDGKSGLLAAEKDAAGLTDAIRRFHAMGQEEYDGFSSNAASFVRTECDMRKSAAALRSIYSELC